MATNQKIKDLNQKILNQTMFREFVQQKHIVIEGLFLMKFGVGGFDRQAFKHIL